MINKIMTQLKVSCATRLLPNTMKIVTHIKKCTFAIDSKGTPYHIDPTTNNSFKKTNVL
jgi:hypothetical protein